MTTNWNEWNTEDLLDQLRAPQRTNEDREAGVEITAELRRRQPQMEALRTEAGAAGDYTLVDEINAALGIEIIDGVEMLTR